MPIKTKSVISRTADSKPVKQEVNGTLILPPLVFPALAIKNRLEGRWLAMLLIKAVKGFIEQAFCVLSGEFLV